MSNPYLLDLMGKKFGKLEVLKRVENSRNRKAQWLCVCDCGEMKVVISASLVRGHTTSCGCYNKSKRVNITHDSTHTPEYVSWCEMKTRCLNKNRKQWSDYGGRGISICDRWLYSFQNFVADMGPKPTKHHTLDRIENDKGYSPDNCKWSTRLEQNRNRRTDILYTFNGKTLNRVEWAKLYNMSYFTLVHRLKIGLSIEESLTNPIRIRNPRA